jgi:hypothetical protein
MERSGERTWQNMHENFEQEVRGILLPKSAEPGGFEEHRRTTASVEAGLREASPDERFRGLGSAWSFSKVAATDGLQLKGGGMGLELPLEDSHVVGGDARRLALFQAGTRIRRVSEGLFRRGLSLKTSGASHGQTLAGAVTTGTHGSAWDFGALPECVVGIHLTTGEGPSLWLERASRPIATERLLADLGASPVRDDATFEAALVSFGSFGFFLALMIEAEDLFLLDASRREARLGPGLDRAIDAWDLSGLDLPRAGERAWHFEIIVNPHDLGGRTEALATVMHKRAWDPSHPPRRDEEPGALEDLLLHIVVGLTRNFDLADAALPDAFWQDLFRRVLRW